MHTFALQIGRVTNRLLHSEMEHLNWQTGSSIARWGKLHVYNKVTCTCREQEEKEEGKGGGGI